MISAGDTIENPVTGERIVFRKTSRDTNGEAVVIECFVQPNGAVAAAHVHPSPGRALPGAPRDASGSGSAASRASPARASG